MILYITVIGSKQVTNHV